MSVMKLSRTILALGLVLGLLAGPIQALSQEASVDRSITMDFNEVNIQVFIKFISELTGTNFVVDEKVRGKVTVLSPTGISVNEAYRVFESVLEVNGFAAVPSGEVTKIVPSVRARQENIATLTRPEIVPRPGDTFVTQIIPLNYADAEEVRKILIPIVSKEGILVAYGPTRTLILTDYRANIQRVIEIVNELDVAQGHLQMVVVRLKHASAERLAGSLGRLAQEQATQAPAEGSIRGGKLKIVPDERLNALIILASDSEMARALKLVGELDQPTPKGKGTIHVVKLENALAENLAKVVAGLPTGGDPAQGQQAGVISRDVKVVADKDSNSLVITAQPDEFEALKEVIAQLDSPREQVFIETSILEVSTDASFNLGVQWQGGAKAGPSGDESLFFGTSNGLIGTSMDQLTTKLAANPDGLSLGVLSLPFLYGGKKYFNLGAFLHAAKSDDNVNIISTPQLMTLENADAKVIVGENRAFTTRQDKTTDNTAYSNYEYKDVGVTLKVTPFINAQGSVKMMIYQEVSRVEGNSLEGTITPVTKKRVAETTVEVKDGETVVIAGLIEDASGTNVTGIPGLMDIPLLGWMFKVEREKTSKKNLLVFLTPHVVRNPEDARSLYHQKARYMERLRYNTDGRAMPLDEAPFVAGPVAATT
ncbi:MAG: type II secretion system protein GspD [Deltaproteobacteria bacterium]|nr:type II secretion system protein GspD [Deltaproteobacteria bacterium]